MNLKSLTTISANDEIPLTFGARLPRGDEVPKQPPPPRLIADGQILQHADGHLETVIRENFARYGKGDRTQEEKKSIYRDAYTQAWRKMKKQIFWGDSLRDLSESSLMRLRRNWFREQEHLAAQLIGVSPLHLGNGVYQKEYSCVEPSPHPASDLNIL